MTTTTDNLFIYGSLAPGCPNHHIVSHIKGNWVEGKVRGRLVEEGWGAALGFPGIILDPEQRSNYFVEGVILCSSSLSANWPMLDEFEGTGYERVITEALVASGENLSVHVYQLKRATQL
jgi:gamma-glutamylcyclotransferase (GGCT)/AIG2-like uncharacterized protein YtfP